MMTLDMMRLPPIRWVPEEDLECTLLLLSFTSDFVRRLQDITEEAAQKRFNARIHSVWVVPECPSDVFPMGELLKELKPVIVRCEKGEFADRRVRDMIEQLDFDAIVHIEKRDFLCDIKYARRCLMFKIRLIDQLPDVGPDEFLRGNCSILIAEFSEKFYRLVNDLQGGIDPESNWFLPCENFSWRMPSIGQIQQQCGIHEFVDSVKWSLFKQTVRNTPFTRQLVKQAKYDLDEYFKLTLCPRVRVYSPNGIRVVRGRR